MAIRFSQDGEYKGARIIAWSGLVAVGAVFPALDQPRSKWGWRVWTTGAGGARWGHAKSELAAKNALLTEWTNFLRSAHLCEDTGEA